MNKALLPLLALGLAGSASAQILDSSGAPNTGFTGFYAWYNADGGPNGGTVSSGDLVTSWTDATGNFRDLVRVSADPLRQPVYDDTGAFPVVNFDGDDFIWANNAAEFGTLVGEKTIFVAARVDDSSNGGYLFDSSSSAGRNAIYAGQQSNPDVWHIYAGAGQPVAGTPVAVGSWNVHSAVFGLNSQEHFVDGVSVSTGAETTAGLSGIVVGARFNVANGHVGAIAEVLVYEGVLADADRQAIEGYLASKYNSSTLGTNYCTAVANSTGGPATISATGSAAAAQNNLTLTASALPTGQFAYFVTGQAPGFIAGPGGSQGNLCIIGQLGRFTAPGQVLNSGSTGEVSLSIDLTNVPLGASFLTVQPGDTWNFTLWYRDNNPSPTSNFTDALEIVFQ
ncbi:MAG: hypothetical protein ISQ08_03510 [Planctomycetes bacterium]|nr:hypothetical protein [Planctomycetota bacterium]